MGVVYLARQESLDRTVAVKVLELGPRPDAELVERFLLEARTAASLTHPGIVPVHDSGQDPDGSLHLTMAYMPGGSLRALLAARGALEPGEIVQVGQQIAAALAYAHRRGVIHRDVKPSNILFDVEGNAYLADFGIAALQGRSGLTQLGVQVGTPEYMAPELVEGKPASARTDVYALGITLYECLTGLPPFCAEDAQAVLFQQVNRPPATLPGSVPLALAEVISTSLQKDPELRYADADAFQAAMVGAVVPSPVQLPEELAAQAESQTKLTMGSEPSTRTAVGKPPLHRGRFHLGRRGRGLVAAVTALLLVMVGLGVALYSRAPVVGTVAGAQLTQRLPRACGRAREPADTLDTGDRRRTDGTNPRHGLVGDQAARQAIIAARHVTHGHQPRSIATSPLHHGRLRQFQLGANRSGQMVEDHSRLRSVVDPSASTPRILPPRLLQCARELCRGFADRVLGGR